MVRNKKKSTKKTLFSIVLAMVSAKLLIILFILSLVVPTSKADSFWTQSTYSDFNSGTLNNVIVTLDGNVTLALQSKYIEEDFTDESKIRYKKNVIIDTVLGEARLIKGINKTYGGSDLDWGWWVQQTVDRGYVIFAETVSFGAGNYDAWLIKTDKQGKEEWSKTYGGTAKDGARSGQQTEDGGYIIGGYADSFGFPGHDGWLIKTDKFGNEQWNYTFGGSSTDAFFSVTQTTDNGFIASGYETSFGTGGYDAWLVKTDSLGIEQWSSSFGGGGSEHGMSVKQASDGGYIIAGDTSSFGAGGTDLWLIKTDEFGNEQWNFTFGGSDDDWGGSVFQTSDGGYIVSGDTKSYGTGGFDVWLIKTDEFGNEEWNMTFGEPSSDDTGYCVHQTLDGGYSVAVSSTSYLTGFTDIWLIKTDNNGFEQWKKTFGGPNNDWAYSVDQTADGGYVITGYTTSYGSGSLDVWLIKTDAYGNFNSEGELISINLLSGESVFSIDMFNCTASIPPKDLIQVQFSQDNLSWYDSTGVLDGWDNLMDGFNSIDLVFLGWSGSDFYYRLNFSSITDGIPAVENVNISYNEYLPSGTLTSQPFNCGETNVNWKTLSWIATEPLGTKVKFQLRSADIQANLSTKSFAGPDGASTTYYDSSPSNIWSDHDGYQWMQFRVYLSGTSEIAPILEEVTIYYDFIPDSPTNLTIEIWGNNLTLNWTAPQNGPSPVDHYLIYRVTDPYMFTFSDSEIVYNSSGTGNELLSTWNDTTALMDESNNYYYVVRAVYEDGQNDTNENIVGKYVIKLNHGWNLISFPLAQKDTKISEVLRSIDSKYNIIQWFDAKEDVWCSSLTSLTDLNRTMGLWIHMKTACNLSVVGTLPESTDIALYEGWNLVGYPSLTTRYLNDTLNNISWQKVWCYNAFDNNDYWKLNNTSKSIQLNDLEEMSPGCGYWVFVTINDTWRTTRTCVSTRSEIWRVYGLKEKYIEQHLYESTIKNESETKKENYPQNENLPQKPIEKKETFRVNFLFLPLIMLILLYFIEIKLFKKEIYR